MATWKMLPANKRIAEQVRDGESPTVLARKTGKSRRRIYQIFDDYCKHCLFYYEYVEAMGSRRPLDRLIHYLKAQKI